METRIKPPAEGMCHPSQPRRASWCCVGCRTEFAAEVNEHDHIVHCHQAQRLLSTLRAKWHQGGAL